MVSQNTLKTLGLTPALHTNNFEENVNLCCLVGVARCPVRRNRSNRLKTGPEQDDIISVPSILSFTPNKVFTDFAWTSARSINSSHKTAEKRIWNRTMR